MKRRVTNICEVIMVGALLIAALSSIVVASPSSTRTYTLDADFDEGTLVNVNHNPNTDQLQLDSAGTPFGFIWIAVSTKGTVVKIDTSTGAVLGEYRTAPQGMSLDPSRTTVDNNGSVWVANRAESGNVAQDAIAPGIPPINQLMGSVVHIGLQENGQCVDRNANSVIDTSTGLGDVKAWSNAGGADTLGGVSTADDECVTHYTRVTSTGTRHVSVDANNDVWVGGLGYRNYDLIDDLTGTIIRHESSVGYGGYGGLIDGNGVIWSANYLLRWDTANSLTGPNGDPSGPSIGPPISGGLWAGQSYDSYGLCIDSYGNVWNTQLSGNLIRKYAPDGTYLGAFAHGFANAQGCVVDGNDHVWVANSLYGSSVGHLLNNGTYIGNVTVGQGPTGVAVDAVGKIWATNYYGQTASRIDPTLGPLGADGVTPVGAVDFTTVNLGGLLYNYSDMTGSTLIAPPNSGTWSVIYDSGEVDARWDEVSWNSLEPGDSAITVKVASSADGVTFGPEVAVANGDAPAVADGQYLKIIVSFSRATTNETPVLYDLTAVANRPDVVYVTFAEPGKLAGINFRDEDILAYNPDTDSWSLIFDGSDVGLGGFAVNGIHLLDDGRFLLSVDRNNYIPGFDGVKPEDIMLFTPTSLGENTAGTLSWFFDGSDVGLSTDNEGVDAIALAPDGRLVVSTWGPFNVPGASGNVRGQDEDLIVFNDLSFGEDTSGTWEMYFDGSDVGLADGDKEDIWGTWIDPSNNDIYLNTKYRWKVPGLQGDQWDIPVFTPTTLGENTTGTYSMFFDPGDLGVSGYNALTIGPPHPLAP